MRKKLVFLLSLLLMAAMISGCAVTDALIALLAPDLTESSDLPHLMVQKIDIAIHPQDPDFERHYRTQENLTATLNLLRDMATRDFPEEEPRLSDGQTYYTITATYASGEQQHYYILGHRFLKFGQEPWCRITTDSAMTFARFIREHQSDDGSYVPPPTEAPTDPTGTAPSEVPTQSA